MYILHNRLKFPKINPNDTFASKAQVIIEFWDDSVNIKLDGPLWKEMVNATNNGNYEILEKSDRSNIEVPQQKSVEIQKFLEVRNIQEVRVFLKFLTQISSKSLAKENARRFPGKFKDINEPFATFYNNYVEAIDNAMTKNFASCALGALLKALPIHNQYHPETYPVVLMPRKSEIH
uniref:Uncharacterized protein n=1 Tax=Rhizophagus irregularis (strain DAOM 181602 / DAOM 197198 / MUCL 43194) TaxID=747089 RepID=U9TUP0_RHIID